MPALIRLQDGRFVNLDAALEIDPQPSGELYLIMPAPSFMKRRAPHVTVIEHPDDVAVAMAYYLKSAGEFAVSLRPKHPCPSSGAFRAVPPVD